MAEEEEAPAAGSDFGFPGAWRLQGHLLVVHWCGKPRINLPFGDGLYHPFIMILGMVYDSVYHMISANQFQVSHVVKNIYDNLWSSRFWTCSQIWMSHDPCYESVNFHYHFFLAQSASQLCLMIPLDYAVHCDQDSFMVRIYKDAGYADNRFFHYKP